MSISIKRLLLIFMSWQFSFQVSAQGPTDLDIYLAIGQSNMAGRATIQPDLSGQMEGVYLFTGEDWIAAKNPLNIYSSIRKDSGMQRLSPAYGFARKMKSLEAHKKLGLVVNAKEEVPLRNGCPEPLFQRHASTRPPRLKRR